MKESDTFYIIDRDEWKRMPVDRGISLSDAELDALRSLNDRLSMKDVKEIYMPILQVMHTYINHYAKHQQEKKKLLDQPLKNDPYIIGVAGSVAVGKSTIARLLQILMSRAYKNKRVELVTTDGFLYPNKELKRRGIMDRKGFPESYDMDRLVHFLSDMKNGRKDVQIPVYSHEHYDIISGSFEETHQPDILIVEGINVLQLPSSEKIYVSDFFDFSIYVDAEPQRIEKWYLQRFGILLQTAFTDPENYYYKYAIGSREEAFDMARNVWKKINLKNLEEYILPTRFRANMIIHKTQNHFIDQILLKKY
ncbi:type I pantothenate kinase [Lacticigenium naphthae]|uniref:type I pantothenate kinase n=1 Tax=Lacticigenium naphthae TaxID=515351 RepID=UPI00040DC898|nr:type I pantothenate kinase [Lacticigenium naphthae]